MKKEESKEKAEKTQGMKKDSEDKEVKDSEQKKEDDRRDPVSEPSPSVPIHSPSLSPLPSLRTRKSPSPPLHSLSDSPISTGHGGDSPISDGHFSAGHGRDSRPPEDARSDPSPESSISDYHFSFSDRVPPVRDEPFFPTPTPADKPFSPPVVVAHRFQVEPKVVTRVDPDGIEGFVGVKEVEQPTGSGGGGGNRRLRPDVTVLLSSQKVAMLNKVLLGLRITAFVFCLTSFSVLAADKKLGWALDSFYLYKEFRYSLSVNVVGFVYSGFQICDLLKYLITRKHIVEHRLRGYFNFALDQILTYLLMSASSSAATRAYDWESNWGEDKFPDMASASVALSFIAFVAFALSSLVSGSILCKFR